MVHAIGMPHTAVEESIWLLPCCSSMCLAVLESEVEQGLRVEGPPEDHFHWYKRTISDLKYNLKDEKASKYIDLLKGRPEINRNLHSSHRRFMDSIHTKVRAKYDKVHFIF